MKKNGMMKNAAILFAAMIITKFIGALLKIPLTNVLGGLGMGYFSAAYSLFSPVYALTVAALPTVITRMVAGAVAVKNYKTARQIRKTGSVVALALGLLGTALILAVALPFSKYIANSPDALPAMFVIAPALFFCCIAAVYRGYFEGLSNMLPTALSQITEAIVKSTLGIALAYAVIAKGGQNALPYAAAAAVVGISVSELCGLIFLLLRTKFKSDGIAENELKRSLPPLPPREIARNIFREATPITIAALAMNVNPLIDLLTINKFCGAFVYGSYTGIATSIFSLVTAVTAMVGKSALPEIAFAFESKNKNALTRGLKILFKGTFALGFPLCFGLTALARPFLTLLYFSKPEEVNVSAPPLVILGTGGMALIAAGMIFSVFLAIGRADLQVKLILIGIAFKLAGNIVFIKIMEMSAAGAALATVICYAAVSIAGLIVLRKILAESFNMNFFSFFLRPLLFALICGLTCYLSYYFVFVNLGSAFRLSAAAASGALIYLIFTALTDGKYIKRVLINKS